MRDTERGLRAATAVLAAALALPIAAQNAGPPRAPRILDTPASPTSTPAPAVQPADLRVSLPPIDGAQRPPNAARLAPLPEDRKDGTEEIIVIGQGWRLPDLGSEWRARQKEAESTGRFTATALPLYDPSEPPLHDNALAMSAEGRRHGYIELFRLRFGRRSSN